MSMNRCREELSFIGFRKLGYSFRPVWEKKNQQHNFDDAFSKLKISFRLKLLQSWNANYVPTRNLPLWKCMMTTWHQKSTEKMKYRKIQSEPGFARPVIWCWAHSQSGWVLYDLQFCRQSNCKRRKKYVK